MLPQHALIDRLRAACQADVRLLAAMLYGSFALGNGDAWSDVDCLLYFADEALPAIAPQAWVAQLGPVAAFYRNEYGVYVAIFADLVRAEFHFDPASALAGIAGWSGSSHFPRPEAAILLDRTGELARQLRLLAAPLPDRDTPATVLELCASLCNWTLMGHNVLQRGENARALEVLSVVHDTLLRLARLAEGTAAERWVRSTGRLEQELSPAAYRRYQACTARLERRDLHAAYREAWGWGRELLAWLSHRHDAALPEVLLADLSARFGGGGQA